MKTKDFKIENFIRTNVQNMAPYSSARDEFTKVADVYLDANENPFENGINRYPDPYQKLVKERLSEIKNIPTQNMILGNGSDEILDLIFRAFCEPKEDNVICTPPTYGMYKVLAGLNDIELKNSVLTVDFNLNVADILSQIDANTKIIFLCSPNNPTGNIIPENQIEEVLTKSNCLVVIDEAYIDFASSPSWTTKLEQYPNLIVCQTLSKAYGMAGIRLGLCFASTKIVSVLNKIKPPYNVNVLTQRTALEALNDVEGYEGKLELILQERESMRDALSELSFVKKIYPSDANFWLIKVEDANNIYNKLLDLGIVIRNRCNQVLCENTLRITIGTPIENEKLIQALRKL
ncbi:histidinol-phosphate transaminase [Urechidicola croceus]|uniref:Histidinol-phosphate aminotransferase n=1 Tax=Urechidicola croceus TaxID=1850246 RepID=A0A1D8P773_9FLAO|nr:histidinol-phosphate transaminase [Urechidicola croceus]AOW20427.1 histidinol-phosphate transaminase [Urechidicola croceus]